MEKMPGSGMDIGSVLIVRFAKLLAMSLVVGLTACSSGGGGEPRNAVLSASTQSIETSASRDSQTAPVEQVTVRLQEQGSHEYFVGIEHSRNAVRYADLIDIGDPEEAVLEIGFYHPSTMPAGQYSDEVTLVLCYDAECEQHVSGSPMRFHIRLTVVESGNTDGGGGQQPPANGGLDELPIAEQAALPHDIIDAEYSEAMDRIVMVSAYPSSALYMLDPATGNELSISLDKPPSSVSLSPDGLQAAVGHDALITVIDLPTLSNDEAEKTVLNVSADVLDVVHGGNGYIYAFPRRDQWESIRSVEIAANRETTSRSYSIYAGTVARLHPNGDRMYGADNGIYPSDIERYDLNSGTAEVSYDSPYHGEYAMCGNLWMHEGGLHIYTACGNVFRASNTRSQDMLYNGRLQLFDRGGNSYNPKIISLSHSQEIGRISLLEESELDCDSFGSGEHCYTVFARYESSFLNLLDRWALAPMEVAGSTYRQRGLFAFHSADGQNEYLLSKLDAMPNPNAEYYWGRLSAESDSTR